MSQSVSAFVPHTCALPGVVELLPKLHRDERGDFIKTHHAPSFAALGLPFVLAEEYVTTSRHGVVRGLHLQTPPFEHAKIVYCAAGEALDVVLDVRLGSPAFGQHARFTLSAERGNVLYIPPGLAHGFCVTGESATLVYKVSSIHAPDHDTGVRWDSAGIDWPSTAPIVSARDKALPSLAAFVSPFRYTAPK